MLGGKGGESRLHNCQLNEGREKGKRRLGRKREMLKFSFLRAVKGLSTYKSLGGRASLRKIRVIETSKDLKEGRLRFLIKI